VPRSSSAMANKALHLPQVMYVSGRGSGWSGESSSVPSAPIVTEAAEEEPSSMP